VIQAEKLTMHYGPVVALQNASFEVAQGEVVGLLGPNGAGKSTTLKILTTYLWPTSGFAKVCGVDILTEPLSVREKIGYLPEVLPLYMEMEVGKYLSFVAEARGLTGAKLKERMDWALEKCGLKVMVRTPISELSKGYKQRTALAQALIHDPEVVILDEPTSGLDPHQIIEIRKLIKELAATKTVVLSTHILAEVEAVSDRIIIISRGKIVADGTIASLQRKAMKMQRIELAVACPEKEAKAALVGIDHVRGVKTVGTPNGISRFHVEAEHQVNLLKEVGELVRTKGWDLVQLSDKPFSLEETFLALTESEEDLRAKGGAE